MNTTTALFLATSLILAPGVVGAMVSGERSFVGYAYDRQDGELVYRELHRERAAEDGGTNLETRYVEPDGDLIAAREVAFPSHGFAPSFRLDDRRTGYLEGSLRDADQVVVFRREPTDRTTEERVIERSEALVVDAGFDRFIAANWERLLSGRSVVAEFVVPSRLRALDFRIRKLEAGSLQGQPVVTFRMTIKNPLFRLLVSPIDVTYHLQDRFLMRYEGISNIRDPAGDPYEVRIEFPLDERSDWREPRGGEG